MAHEVFTPAAFFGRFGRNKPQAPAEPVQPPQPIEPIAPLETVALLVPETPWNPASPAFFSASIGTINHQTSVMPITQEQAGQIGEELGQRRALEIKTTGDHSWEIQFASLNSVRHHATTWEEIAEMYEDDFQMDEVGIYEAAGLTPQLYEAIEGEIYWQAHGKFDEETEERLAELRAEAAETTEEGSQMLAKISLTQDAETGLVQIQPNITASNQGKQNFSLHRVTVSPDGYLEATRVSLDEATTFDPRTEQLVVTAQRNTLDNGFPQLTTEEPKFGLNTMAGPASKRRTESVAMLTSPQRLAGAVVRMLNFDRVRQLDGNSRHEGIPDLVAILPAIHDAETIIAETHEPLQNVLRGVSHRLNAEMGQLTIVQLTERITAQLQHYFNPEAMLTSSSLRAYRSVGYSDKQEVSRQLFQSLTKAVTQGRNESYLQATAYRYLMLRNLLHRGILTQHNADEGTRLLENIQPGQTILQIHNSGRVHEFTGFADGTIQQVIYGGAQEPTVNILLPEAREGFGEGFGSLVTFAVQQDEDPQERVEITELMRFMRYSMA